MMFLCLLLCSYRDFLKKVLVTLVNGYFLNFYTSTKIGVVPGVRMGPLQSLICLLPSIAGKDWCIHVAMGDKKEPTVHIQRVFHRPVVLHYTRNFPLLKVDSSLYNLCCVRAPWIPPKQYTRSSDMISLSIGNGQACIHKRFKS